MEACRQNIADASWQNVAALDANVSHNSSVTFTALLRRPLLLLLLLRLASHRFSPSAEHIQCYRWFHLLLVFGQYTTHWVVRLVGPSTPPSVTDGRYLIDTGKTRPWGSFWCRPTDWPANEPTRWEATDCTVSDPPTKQRHRVLKGNVWWVIHSLGGRESIPSSSV